MSGQKGGTGVVAAGAEMLKNDGKVLVGKNARLFLHNDTNQVLRQHTGDMRLTERQLEDWRLVLENRVSWLSMLGIPYYFVVPPNAHAVYPEDLPDGIGTSSQRPVLQLIDHLYRSDSYARVIYPLEEIVAAKPHPCLYSLTDPHWTSLAAFRAYRILASEISALVPVHRVSESDVRYFEHMEVGELGYKLSPKRSSPDIWLNVERPQGYLVSDNQVFNRGSMVVTDCPDAPPTTCILFGDSFSGRLLPLLAASFRRFVFAHLATLDYSLVRELQPDVVIGLMNERFLVNVAYDVGAPSLRDLEREKKASGQTRPPLGAWPDVP